jgi:hypothetical protein
MRTFLDGNGNDSTTAVKAYLAQHRQLLVADLIEIKTLVEGAPWSKDLLLTPAAEPLTWSRKGTFVPARIKRGEIESKIGLEATSLDLEWYLRESEIFAGSLTMLQSFERGLWDGGTVRLYRSIMPTPGDCNTLGACELFAGRIANVSMTRMGVSLTINSPLELLDQQIPSNLIQPGNPTAEYGQGEPPAGMPSVPTFTVEAGSTAAVIIAGCTGPTAGQLFAADAFDFGYLNFAGGTAKGQLGTVRRSDQYAGHNRFYLYEPLRSHRPPATPSKPESQPCATRTPAATRASHISRRQKQRFEEGFQDSRFQSFKVGPGGFVARRSSGAGPGLDLVARASPPAGPVCGPTTIVILSEAKDLLLGPGFRFRFSPCSPCRACPERSRRVVKRF